MTENEGARRLEYAAGAMRALGAITAAWTRTRPLAGHRIAASLHVTAETAQLCRALVAGGAEVALCASSPFSTQPEVARHLSAALGIRVFAEPGADEPASARQRREALAVRPTLIVDDGGELTEEAHRTGLVDAVVGGTEITASGVTRLRDLAAAERLRFPVYSIDDTRLKQVFDNRHGTGQTTIDALLRATNTLLAGASVVVAGYGGVGRGIAERVRGLGGIVTVTETDPLRALEASFDGFAVAPMAEAIARADLVLTATGAAGVVRAEHLAVAPDGIVLANAGHFAVELDLAGLQAMAVERRRVRPHVEAFRLPGGRHVLVVADGGPIGLAVSPGPGVHPVPARTEEAVASLVLAARRLRIDAP